MSKVNKVKVRTGGTAPFSGQYAPEGLKNQEITLIKGKRIPPFGGKARNYKLVDKTK